MSQQPPINPDINDIVGRANHAYAIGTRELTVAQHRLAWLAGTGRLDPDESMRVQCVLADLSCALYLGTTCAVRVKDVNAIADGAKYFYAVGSYLLARVHYRLARLAGTGRLDREESMRVQRVLADIWWALYSGTTQAVRDQATDDDTWDEADNTYSDGRTVTVQSRIEPVVDWEHSRFLWGEGAVLEHRRGTTSHISRPPPHAPEDRRPHLRLIGGSNASPKATDFAALQALVLSVAAPDDSHPRWIKDAIAQVECLNDYDDGSAGL